MNLASKTYIFNLITEKKRIHEGRNMKSMSDLQKFHIKGTKSVHSFNGDYLSIPEGTGSCGYLFHEIPCIIPENAIFSQGYLVNAFPCAPAPYWQCLYWKTQTIFWIKESTRHNLISAHNLHRGHPGAIQAWHVRALQGAQTGNRGLSTGQGRQKEGGGGGG